MKKKKQVRIWGLKDFNAQHHVELKYDYEYSCGIEGCYDEGVCRCGKIVDPKIEDEFIDYTTTLNAYKNLKPNNFEKYCIDRILNHYKVYDPELWYINIDGGYYGEEIGKVVFDNPTKIDETVKNMMNLKTNKQKILMVLELEYGYLLDELKNKKSWRIRKIKRDNLIIGQKDHYKKVNVETVDRYEDYSLPKGVCLPENDKFRLIDGYHRIAASKDEMISVVC